MALCTAVNETEYLRGLLTEVGSRPTKPTTCFVDNKGTRDDSYNRTGRRTRHMNIRFHRVREAAATGTIDVMRVRGGNDKDTSEMLADILTKATYASLFAALSNRLTGNST